MPDYDEQSLLQAMEYYAARDPLFLVPRDTAEWDYMWGRLAAHFVNDGQAKPTVCYNAECGEVWQYMGTVKRGALLWHEFRHRMHPGSGQREYLRVQATDSLAVRDGRLVECG